MSPATRLYFFMTAVLSLLLFPQVSMAGNPLHGARAAAMATAFTGVADDPSAIMHNPAGLVLLKGTNIYAGGSAMIISTSYKSHSGKSQDAEFQTFYIPHLYITSDAGKEGLAFGLGIHSPFGLGGRKWAKDGVTQYSSVESYTATFAINPTIALEVMPGFSVAAGVDYMRAMTYMELMLDQSSLGAGDAKMTTATEGDGAHFNSRHA